MTPSPQTFHALQALHGARYRWWLLASVMLGTMAAVMSATVVNVAIPELSRHFDLGQERAQWVSSGFMAAMTVSMLTTPWLLARFGYRRVYLSCMLMLLLGGVVGGLAGNYGVVMAARLLEGLAAGVIQPIPPILMLRVFEGRDQGRASAIFGMGVVLAPALGPSAGGILVDHLGWRSIFFMVVPFCIASMLMARRYLPGRAEALPAAAPTPGLDALGLLLASTGTLALLAAVAQWREGGLSALPLAALGASCALSFVLWLRAARLRGRSTLLDLGVFRSRTFAMGSVVAFVYGAALFGSTYLLPVYMQLALGFSASHVGTILLPAGLVLALTIGAVGRFAHALPAHRVIGVGLSLLALSFALMPWVELGGGMALLLAWSMLGRVGLGLVLPSLSIAALRALERERVPAGSSTINFLRTLGGALGVGSCAVLLEWRVSAHGDNLVHPIPTLDRLAAFNETFVVLALICSLSVIAAWRMKPQAS